MACRRRLVGTGASSVVYYFSGIIIIMVGFCRHRIRTIQRLPIILLLQAVGNGQFGRTTGPQGFAAIGQIIKRFQECFARGRANKLVVRPQQGIGCGIGRTERSNLNVTNGGHLFQHGLVDTTHGPATGFAVTFNLGPQFWVRDEPRHARHGDGFFVKHETVQRLETAAAFPRWFAKGIASALTTDLGVGKAGQGLGVKGSGKGSLEHAAVQAAERLYGFFGMRGLNDLVLFFNANGPHGGMQSFGRTPVLILSGVPFNEEYDLGLSRMLQAQLLLVVACAKEGTLEIGDFFSFNNGTEHEFGSYIGWIVVGVPLGNPTHVANGQGPNFRRNAALFYFTGVVFGLSFALINEQNKPPLVSLAFPGVGFRESPLVGQFLFGGFFRNAGEGLFVGWMFACCPQRRGFYGRDGTGA